MITDDRDLPLDEFETALLARLAIGQAAFCDRTELTPEPGSRFERSRHDRAVRPFVVRLNRRGRRSTRVRGPGSPVRGLVAVGSVVVVAVGVTVILGSGSKSASATPALPRPLTFAAGGHAAALGILTQAAQLASGGVDGGRPVRYAKTQNYALQTNVGHHLSTTVVATTVRSVWVAPDGRAKVTEYIQDTNPAGGDVGGPKPAVGIDHTGTYTGGRWADPNLSLPATTASAFAALQSQVTQSVARDVITDAATLNFTIGGIAGTVLQTGTATPAQTAAAYQLLAAAPGVFDAGSVVDSAGRRGHAVGLMISDPSVTIATGTEYFIIDRTTGRFLETETVDTPDAPPGLKLPAGPTVAEYELILSSGSVSALGTALTQPDPH